MDTTNWLQQLLTLGIGTTTIAVDKLREIGDEWVRSGRLDPEQARRLVDELVQRLQNAPGQEPGQSLEAQIQQQLRQVMHDLGLPDRREIEELRGRVARLERQVRDLENKSWR